MAAMILEVEKLDLFYGDAQALEGISLAAEEGELIAIVGANGAGKSSLIRTIAGIESPRSGRIRFRGQDITGLPSYRICNMGVGQVAEGRQVFPSLTVEENLEMGALLPRARSALRQTLAEAYAMFPRLAERRTQAAGTMSGGEQQMLAIARCLMGKPELIMFDEPSLGLAPALVQELFRTIRALNQQGAHRAAGRAERGRLPQARGPRLCARERPHRHVRHGRGAPQRRPRSPGLSRHRRRGRLVPLPASGSPLPVLTGRGLG